MKGRFEQIRQLLNEIEELADSSAVETSDRNFSALELPLIIQEIVDDLQPLLTTYQAVFYWYLFRHSFSKNGNPLLRVSTRGMQVGVVRTSRGTEATTALQQVRETLAALESIGAIRKEGEPNRDGTLYRIFIPDEIEACRKFRGERTAAKPKVEASDDRPPNS